MAKPGSSTAEALLLAEGTQTEQQDDDQQTVTQKTAEALLRGLSPLTKPGFYPKLHATMGCIDHQMKRVKHLFPEVEGFYKFIANF